MVVWVPPPALRPEGLRLADGWWRHWLAKARRVAIDEWYCVVGVRRRFGLDWGEIGKRCEPRFVKGAVKRWRPQGQFVWPAD